MSLRRRLKLLEAHAPDPWPRGSPDNYPTLATEVREIDRTIKRLEAEIAEAEAGMTPAELARKRAEFEEFDATLVGLSLDEKIEALEAEISILEAEEGEGGA
jgi:predicted  nucleic acid-binding Zn-ribbon protein